MKRPAILPKQSDEMPTLKTLAANAMVKDKIKYFEKLSDKQSSTTNVDKKAVSLQRYARRGINHTACVKIYERFFDPKIIPR